jgi:hypothetical protein
MGRNDKITLITKKILFRFLSILDSNGDVFLSLLGIYYIEFGFAHWTVIFFSCAPFENAVIAIFM